MESYIAVTFTADEENASMLGAMLMDMGFAGIEEKDQGAHTAAVLESLYDRAQADELFKRFGVKYTINTIQPQNWNAAWEASFQPVQVDDFACIRAKFHPVTEGVLHDIIVTPKMSFGTGHHATTYMMIAEMRTIDFSGKKVIDFGTGTGVLAILAERLGATEILAIDNDEWSIENAEENILVNCCKHIKVELAQQMVGNFQADVVLANINLNVIVANLQIIKEGMQSGGLVLFSGVLLQDQPAITIALKNAGYQIQKISDKNGWLLISTSIY